MPRQESPRLKISYGWLRGEDYWGDPMSTNMLLADALTHPSAISMNEPAPPSAVQPGAQYILPKAPIGEWAPFPDALVTFHGESGWFVVSAFRGLRVDVQGVGFAWYDGADWQLEGDVEEDPIAGAGHDIILSVGYAPVPGETLLFFPVGRSLYLPADALGSVATTRNPPSRAVALSVRRNGVEVGSVIFSPSSFAGTFVFPGAVVFSPTDRIEVIAPAEVPMDFETFGMTIRSVRMP